MGLLENFKLLMWYFIPPVGVLAVDSSITLSPQAFKLVVISFLLPVTSLDMGMSPTQCRPELRRKDSLGEFQIQMSLPLKGERRRSDLVFFWMWLCGQWHRELLWPSFHDTEDKAEDGRVKKWNNPIPYWHHWAALSTNLGVHPSSELPVMWGNKIPYYLSQNESVFLLLVAKSILADTLH